MGRNPKSRALAVWANGLRVGEWRVPARGEMELHYDAAWMAAPEGRPLSLSLPYGLDQAPVRGPAVEAYFENLLPDADAIRRRLQQQFRLTSGEPFDLLAAIGRDCVGAVQLLDLDEAPAGVTRIDAEPLSDAEVERALVEAVAPPGFGVEVPDFRISLAGAQEKTAFLRHQGRWCRPRGATPTTHIFKLPLGLVGGMRADMSDSVENEWLCARILRAFGIPVAQCEIGRFGDQKVLIVERFDRQLHSSGNYWLRLVQEDFCQAHGLPSAQKYERDGGPGVLELARILRGSIHREADLATLFKAQLLFWMLAATDSHAKNFSLRLLAGGRFQLTPLYDVLSLWPIIGEGPNLISWHDARLAMAVRGRNTHYHLRDIQRRHFDAMAEQCGLGDQGESLIGEVLAATPGVIADVQRNLPEAFPQRLLDAVLGGLSASAERLAAMPSGPADVPGRGA